jgi:hypothetical protein
LLYILYGVVRHKVIKEAPSNRKDVPLIESLKESVPCATGFEK